MSVGLPSTTRGVCREIRFCSSAGKSNLFKTFCSDLFVVKRLKRGISHTGCEPRIGSKFLKDLDLGAVLTDNQ